MKRIGTIMRLKPDKLEEYTALHQAIWEPIVQAGRQAHMQNYTIFHRDGWLFSYFEYTGEDYQGDMARKNALEDSRLWQEATGRLREYVEGDAKVVPMDEIWHCDF